MTPGHEVLLPEDTLQAGQHVSLMGADGPGKAEIAVDELLRTRIFADDWEQASHNGELVHAVEAGRLERSGVTELGAVLAGTTRRGASPTMRSRPSTRQASRSRTSRSPWPRSSARTSWISRPLSSSARAAILVEGTSDMVAIEALAERRGVDTDALGVSLVPIGGAQAIGRYLAVFVPQGLKLRGSATLPRRASSRASSSAPGSGSNLMRKDMEQLGFFVCVEDLEDELIRAHGAAAVEQVIEAEGDLGSFRTLQKQPAWAGRPVEEQLRRFMGRRREPEDSVRAAARRRLDLDKIPRPLDRVLRRKQEIVTTTTGRSALLR